MQRLILLCSFLLVIPAIVFSQVEITGKVINEKTKKTLPGAHISVESTGISIISNDDGDYKITNLEKGEYNINVSYLGFETKKVRLTLSEDTNFDILLTPISYFSEEVIISAIRASEESPTTYTVLTQSEIKERNTGQDLPYLLKTTPSVVVSSDAGAGIGYTGMRIRGTDLTGINVTLNGVPVNDGESHSVYFVDLPDLASSIQDMQIQRGVGTSTNGAASFGASININTGIEKSIPFAEISSSVGSFNTLKSTVMFGSGTLNKRWNFSGRLSSITSDGYIDRASSNLKSAYLSGSYVGENDILKAIIILGNEKTYQAWYGVPKDSLKTNRTYNPAGEMNNSNGEFLGYYNNQTDNYTQNYYQLHYAHKFNDKLNFTSSAFLTKGKGYYESYKNDEDFADYGLNDTIIGNDTITSTNMIQQKWLDNSYYGLNLAFNYSASKLKLNIGGGYSYYDGDHFGKIIWAQVQPINSLDRNWYYNKGKKSDLNIFAKANYSVNENLIVYGDLQYRAINYKIEGIHDDLRDLTQSHNFNFLNPKAGILYKLNDKNSLYLSMGVANREPNRSVYRDADTSQNITSERLIDYELGYKYQANKLIIEANGYYMDYKDQFVLTGKINNVGSPIMINVPKSFRAGIEVVAAYRFSKFLDWNINAAYSQNKIRNFTAYVDNWNTWGQESEDLGTTDISFSPNLVASSDIGIYPVKNLKINLISKYVSRQFIDNTSNKERSLDPYLVNNITIAYTIKSRFVKQIDLLLSLNNIFNEKYETNAWVYRYYYDGSEYEMNGYFPQAEFNFMFGVNLGF